MINDLFSLNRLFVSNIIGQLTGGREAMQQFVPRQKLKMRSYFALINFWEAISKELEGGKFDPKSLETGGRVFKLYEAFQQEMTAIFENFDIGIEYNEEGLFERWRDGLGQVLNRALLGTRGALYRELEYEFERFWTGFFQLVRKPTPVIPLDEPEYIVQEMITIRAANFTKLRELGIHPEFLNEAEGEISTLALKEEALAKYIQKDIVISVTSADESAQLIADRLLPNIMVDVATMFSASLDGETLLKVYNLSNQPRDKADISGDQAKSDPSKVGNPANIDEKLEQVIQRELGMELRYALQVAIGLSRILYQSIKDNPEVQVWMDTAYPKESSEEVIRILEGGPSLGVIAASDEQIGKILLNSPENDLPDLRYTPYDPVNGGEASLMKYFNDEPKPFSEIANLPELFTAAYFAGNLRHKMPNADKIITQHFSQYGNPLPGEGLERVILAILHIPTVNDLLKKLTFKPLWARDKAWLERSLKFLADKVDSLNLATQQLRATVLESTENEPGSLFPKVGDRLSMVYAYRTVLDRKGDIRDILIARLQEQLYGRISSELDDIHEWVANAVSINLKELLMADLSGVYMESPNPDKNKMKLFGLDEEYIENIFPVWNKKMNASFVAPIEKKLSLSLDLQLGHEFPGYKVLEGFNYLQDYDRSTLRGVLSSFLQSVSDVLSQSYSLKR